MKSQHKPTPAPPPPTPSLSQSLPVPHLTVPMPPAIWIGLLLSEHLPDHDPKAAGRASVPRVTSSIQPEGPRGPQNPRQSLSGRSPAAPLLLPQHGQGRARHHPCPALCALGSRQRGDKLLAGYVAWSPASSPPVHVIFGPWALVTLQEHLRGGVAEGALQS